MTTTTRRPPTTLNAIFHWRSLRTRVTLSTLVIFLIGIWSLTSYTSRMLREDMRHLLGEQIFSTVSIIAADINAELDDRLKALEEAARRITPAMLDNAASMQTFLEDRTALFRMFNGGLWVARLDGAVIADVPVSAGRIGVNYCDRDWVVEVLKGKSIIAAPVMGRKLKSPVIPIAAPIRDSRGKVIGFLTGVIDLGMPNFLGKITDNRYGKTGGYRLIAPHHNLFVTATDKSRIMQPLPAPGINSMHDRYMQGFEGFGIAVNSRGIEELSAAKRIPITGWFILATLPTEEAFAPINALQRRMLLAAIFLTLLASGLTWWMLKRQLAPVFTTIKTLATLSDTNQHPQPLPITRQDEVGELIGGFNRLLETLGQREEALKKSEEKFRDLYDNAPVGYHEYDAEGRITNVNRTTSEMLSYSPQEMIGQYMWHFNVEEDIARQQILEKLAGLRSPGRSLDRTYRRKDRTTLPVLIEDRLRKDEQGRITGIRCTIQDITERERAKEALRESENKFKCFAEQSFVGIYLIQDGVFQYVNPRFAQIFGYSVEECAKMHFRNLVFPEDLEKVKEQVRRRISGEVDFVQYKFRGIKKNREIIDVEIYGSSIIHGEKPAAIGTMLDITERKLEEQAQMRLVAMLDATPGFVGFADAKDTHILYINPAGRKMVGVQAQEDVTQLKIADIHPEWTNKLFSDEIIPTAIRDGMWTGECAFLNRDGHEISVMMTFLAHKSPSGEVERFSTVSIDITERKQAEEKFREMTGRLHLATASAKAGVWDWNFQTNEMIWDDRMLELYGLTHENFPGGVEAWEQGLHPDDSSRAIEESQAALRGERDFDTEFRVRRPDGTVVHIKANGLVLRDKEGKPLRMIGLNTDITERKRTEEENRSLQERLQRAEKMEALGTLAGGVAHDLNNVLGIVVGYAELILMNADESSSIRPHLVNIMSGGMKAAAIVDDLLTLARRGVSGRDVLNLNKIIADCQQSPEFEKLYSYHPSVEIKTDIEPGLPNISGSSVHLVKSLYNLVSNASEAMTKGGIVTIKTANQYLDKPIQGYDRIQEGDYVVLSVSDTGEGIHEVDLKRIFEPFYTKKVMGRSGTGLGLAVVWGTVKDHHGYINVESEEGRGSTFTLYFPVTREDITAEAVAVTISEYMGSGESILVVDDVKEQRDLAAGMLRTLNYNVSIVSSGEEAVAYMKEHEVDLMVLDMIMDPGMDGLDTYRSVLAIHPKQKAIIVSGFSESDRVKTAKDLGAGAYVRKPYIIEKLGLAVRKELDRSA